MPVLTLTAVGLVDLKIQFVSDVKFSLFCCCCNQQPFVDREEGEDRFPTNVSN